MNVSSTRHVALAVSLLVAFCDPQAWARGAGAPTTVITDVTVISPEHPAPLTHAYVRIANGRIAEVTTHPLKGDVKVDGRGKFLIPGLIDSHMHLGSVPGMQAPQRAAHPDLVAQAVAQEPRTTSISVSRPCCRSATPLSPSIAGMRSTCGLMRTSAAAHQS